MSSLLRKLGVTSRLELADIAKELGAEAPLGAPALPAPLELFADRSTYVGRRGLASEVVLEPTEDPVPRPSAVNLDSVESVAITTLVERLGRLSDDRMRQVCAALEIAVDLSMSAAEDETLGQALPAGRRPLASSRRRAP